MARSNKPLIWLPFAAGGMLSALFLPAIALILLADALGLAPDRALDHARIHAALSFWPVAVALFALIGLSYWHAAHRLRMTVQDLGVRTAGPRRVLAWICYLLAAAGTAALVFAVSRL